MSNQLIELRFKILCSFIQARRSVIKLFNSRDNFSRLYSDMSLTRISLSETKYFLIFSGVGFFFYFNKELNTSFPHSLLTSGTKPFISILQNRIGLCGLCLFPSLCSSSFTHRSYLQGRAFLKVHGL